MPRPPRIEYPGALYHVTSRGNKKETIFKTDEDRLLFLNFLYTNTRSFDWVCHAYCLMDNHYHLLIETRNPNLSIGMRQLNGNYTRNYNTRHDTIGHLFQGRFKAFILEKEAYFLEVARYIVLNPVRAGMVIHPSEWDWSSYNATVTGSGAQQCLDSAFLLSLFSSNLSEARRRYGCFIQDGIGHLSPFTQVQHGVILGTSQFVTEMLGRIVSGREVSGSDLTPGHEVSGLNLTPIPRD